MVSGRLLRTFDRQVLVEDTVELAMRSLFMRIGSRSVNVMLTLS